jgi:hypothetical protein
MIILLNLFSSRSLKESPSTDKAQDALTPKDFAEEIKNNKVLF